MTVNGEGITHARIQDGQVAELGLDDTPRQAYPGLLRTVDIGRWIHRPRQWSKGTFVAAAGATTDQQFDVPSGKVLRLRNAHMGVRCTTAGLLILQLLVFDPPDTNILAVLGQEGKTLAVDEILSVNFAGDIYLHEEETLYFRAISPGLGVGTVLRSLEGELLPPGVQP